MEAGTNSGPDGELRITELKKIVVTEGNKTNFPAIGAMIEMHYTGYLFDPKNEANAFKGKKFDSSYDRRSPLASKIGVGSLINGWDVCVPQMSLGEKARLEIPAANGYGKNGYPPVIPRDSDLIFDVELVSIGGRRA